MPSPLRRLQGRIQREYERRVPLRMVEPRPRIVVTLTTTPHRIEHIRTTLESLRAQTLQPNEIVVSVPHVYERDGLRYEIPEWLPEMPAVRVHRTLDRGPATKLLGALEIEKDPDTILITVDDDNDYPEFLVRGLVRRSLRDPHSVHAVSAGDVDVDASGVIRPDSEWGIRTSRKNGQRVFMLEGHAGVAYRRRMLEDDIFDMPFTCRACFLCDDPTLSFYLSMKNVPVRVARNALLRQPWKWALDYGMRSDALHYNEGRPTSRNADRGRECLRELRRRYPSVSIAP